jgi:hypothetical protein
LIFVEPALSSFAHRFTMVDLGIERAVYSPHMYGNSFNDAQNHAGDFAGPAQFKPDLALGEQEAANIGAAPWPGEWGALDPNNPVGYREVEYARDMLAAQDEAQVGSAYWTYSRTEASWGPALVAVFTRPSVFAVAGDPLAITGDEHHLHLRWKASAGTTRVSLPAGWAPKVSTVGPVTVGPTVGTGWLDLSAPAGATVEVDVTGP